MKIVVSGAMGSGKSTAVRAAMKQLGWNSPGGFFTHWGGAERGAPILYVETWAGEVLPMARRVSASEELENPPYELDLGQFNRGAIGSISRPGRPVVIDELGLIELGAADFIHALAEAFRGSADVLVVIQQRALKRWMRLLGPENATHLLLVEPATRAALPAQIAALFQD
jgi:nucleoside-triphosphatase THEP1